MNDVDEWVSHMFQITKPRLLDLFRLAGFDRHSGRLGMLLSTIIQLPQHISAYGISHATRWVIKRHPREVALCLFLLTIFQAIPNDIPDVSIWVFVSIYEMFRGICTVSTIQYTNKQLTIGVIPDGNRRWGKTQHVGSCGGHFYGSARVMECIRTSIIDTRIGHLVMYVMSYDNIQKRSKQEQLSLLAILRGWVQELIWLRDAGLIDICVCGEPTDEVKDCLNTIPINPVNDPDAGSGSRLLKVSLLIGYDGRREIQHAHGDPAKLWVTDTLDGVIRTGGTHRASGFCTYQTGYSEWVFTDIMWPEMTPQRFHTFISKIEESVESQNHGK
jgi:undecaprenyl diphosphate synthase